MGRGGGGGGGRSSGGGSRGGSRSSGGSRGGSSFSRGGRGSSFSSSSRGGYHSHHTYHHHHHTPYYGRTHHHHHYSGPASTLSTVLSFVIVLIIVLAVIAPTFLGAFGGNITASTIEREKLDSQYVTTTDWYDDNMGWIGSSSKLESGMKSFYKETGVQPYLYLTETVNGSSYPSDAEMEAFANSLYDELFDDEGHLLVVFQEYNSDGNYFAWCVAGKQAKTVFDNEARDIFFDYLDHYYYSDLSEEEFFSTTFEKTGERMMEVTPNPIVKIVAISAGVIVIFIGFTWWKKAKKQKNLEAEQTERILNTDIDDLAKDPALADLESKYDN